jgi:zinc protease
MDAISSVTLLPALAWQLSSAAAPSVGEQSTTSNEVVRTTLPDGLRVIIVPNSLAPVATTVVNYFVGSNEAPPGFPAWPMPRNT